MFLRACCFAIFACVSAATFADSPSDPVTIPLKDIWAYRMPGTKDIRELEPDHYGDKTKNLSFEDQQRLRNESLVEGIRTLLDKWGHPAPGPAFVVTGNPQDALKQSWTILVKNKERPQITINSDVTVVFFSYGSSTYVMVKKVERLGTVIGVEYEIVPYREKLSTVSFALIPIGKLPTGTFQVKFTRLPTNNQSEPVTNELVSRVMCKPFSFKVEDK